jgi:hypothetical protein
MYRGGFLLLALLAALLIATTVHPASRLSARVFALPVFVWVGVRSYGIYLWHWPIYMVTRPHSDVPLTGIPLLGLRLALTFLFAAASYKYVEEPIRHGALGRRWGEFRRAKGERRRQLGTGFAVAGSALVAGVLVITAGFLGAGPTPRPPGLPTQAALVLKPTTTTTDPSAAATTTTVAPGGPAVTTTAPAVPAPVATHVTALGDSVMLGAAQALQDTIGADRVLVDAEESRQFPAGVDKLQFYRDSGQLGEEVVIQLGTNGTINPEDFDRMMDVLKGVKKVVVLNARVPRPWEEQVNQVLSEGVKRYKNHAVLIDWHTIAGEHPEFFWDDGIHLRPEGAQYYAQLVAGYL